MFCFMSLILLILVHWIVSSRSLATFSSSLLLVLCFTAICVHFFRFGLRQSVFRTFTQILLEFARKKFAQSLLHVRTAVLEKMLEMSVRMLLLAKSSNRRLDSARAQVDVCKLRISKRKTWRAHRTMDRRRDCPTQVQSECGRLPRTWDIHRARGAQCQTKAIKERQRS